MLQTYIEPVESIKPQPIVGGVALHESFRLLLWLVGDLAQAREEKGVLGREFRSVQVWLHLHLSSNIAE